MGRLFAAVLLLAGISACAAPRAAGAPLAPLGRSWAVPTLGLYQEWWDKTVACSGKSGKMTDVQFYAVDAPAGAMDAADDVDTVDAVIVGAGFAGLYMLHKLRGLGFTAVVFEVARVGSTTPLVRRTGRIAQTTGGTTVAQETLPASMLPPGRNRRNAITLPSIGRYRNTTKNSSGAMASE